MAVVGRRWSCRLLRKGGEDGYAHGTDRSRTKVVTTWAGTSYREGAELKNSRRFYAGRPP